MRISVLLVCMTACGGAPTSPPPVAPVPAPVPVAENPYKQAEFGVELAPGAYEVPSGFRFVYGKQQTCGTSLTTGCSCHDMHFIVTADKTVGVPELGSVRAFGMELRRVGNGIALKP